ncbi:MAG: hypothetical protein COV44_11680 [Deltaproteobacteria bacterium CG11_big_fil_rev_8_21_14_0_20_45_16]|nr:MAG: hypothetical protein COV44_11680 [Deltaproteobacteria bacterium CG11_big_fil_rev_8_21_14_0_20_45_16]
MPKDLQKRMNEEISELRSRLDTLGSDVFSKLQSDKKKRLHALEKHFSKLCELHKDYNSEAAHHEIRSARDQLKRSMNELLSKKDLGKIESEIAVQELQAEAVAFVKASDLLMDRELREQDIDRRIGVGVEIDDALGRIGVSVPKLRQELQRINMLLLIKKVQNRVDDYIDERKYRLALEEIDNCRLALGAPITEEFFADLYEDLRLKASRN